MKKKPSKLIEFAFRLGSSLSFRILITLLFISFVPLILFGMYSKHFVEKTIYDASNQTSEIIGSRVMELYQSNLANQAGLINLELKNVEKSVMAAKRYAEQIFSHPQHFPQLIPIRLTKEEQGYAWEKDTPATGSNTGVSIGTEVTPQLMERLSRSKYLEPNFQQNIESNKNIAAMYFILPESAWRIYPAINMKREVDEKYFNPSVQVTSYPFYTLALPEHNPAGKAAWTAPYLDITHRNWMLTASAPVIGQDGTILGVIGADVTVDNLVDNILNTKFDHPNAYAFLINQEGKLIAVQKQGEKQVSNLPIHRIVEHVKEEAPLMMHLDGNQILLTSSVSTSNWYLGYVIPRDEMISPIYEQANHQILQSGKSIVTQLMLASIIVTCLCIGITILMWNRIMNPLRKLVHAIADVGSGNFNVNLPENEITEFNHLSTSFNQMSQELNLRKKELMALNEQLESKVAERTEELKQTNDRLVCKHQQLKEMEESRSTLFSNISHDLKTPLTLISGYIEAMRDGLIPAEEEDIYLEKIQQRISSVNRLVRDLYELSLFETKTISLHCKSVRMDQFMENILRRWGTSYASGSLINISLPKEEPNHAFHRMSLYIYIDQDYIHRAIDNLIENAQKYGYKNSPILLELAYDDHFLYISVHDKGPGIAKEHLPFLFNRSYRIDKARNTAVPGHGLGLAIVKEILAAHQGQVTVKSELDKGATFTLQLPLRKGEV